jgi:hypothetical protein
MLWKPSNFLDCSCLLLLLPILLRMLLKFLATYWTAPTCYCSFPPAEDALEASSNILDLSCLLLLLPNPAEAALEDSSNFLDSPSCSCSFPPC